MGVTHPSEINAKRRESYRACHPLGSLACDFCGAWFNQKRPWQRFCTDGCSRKQRVSDGRTAAAQKRHRERDPEHTRALNREYMRRSRSTPEGKRAKKSADLKYGYGITIEIYEAIAAQQNGLCVGCLRKLDMGFNTHVDHDHKSGAVRGLLCSPCNRGIGNFHDDPAALRRAAAYLEMRDRS
jgi:hypothetical protein